MKYLGNTVWTLLLIILTIISKGYVISKLWNWYVPEIFNYNNTLTIVEAICLSLLIQIFLPILNEDKINQSGDSYIEVVTTRFINYIFVYFFLLFTGWIYYRYFLI